MCIAAGSLLMLAQAAQLPCTSVQGLMGACLLAGAVDEPRSHGARILRACTAAGGRTLTPPAARLPPCASRARGRCSAFRPERLPRVKAGDCRLRERCMGPACGRLRAAGHCACGVTAVQRTQWPAPAVGLHLRLLLWCCSACSGHGCKARPLGALGWRLCISCSLALGRAMWLQPCASMFRRKPVLRPGACVCWVLSVWVGVALAPAGTVRLPPTGF